MTTQEIQARIRAAQSAANLGGQLAAYIQTHPTECAGLLEAMAVLAIQYSRPDDLHRLHDVIPAKDRMGEVLRGSVATLAIERETQPFRRAS